MADRVKQWRCQLLWAEAEWKVLWQGKLITFHYFTVLYNRNWNKLWLSIKQAQKICQFYAEYSLNLSVVALSLGDMEFLPHKSKFTPCQERFRPVMRNCQVVSTFCPQLGAESSQRLHLARTVEDFSAEDATKVGGKWVNKTFSNWQLASS